MTGDIPWTVASRTAERAAGRHPLAGTHHIAVLEEQMPAMVRRAHDLVAHETGLDPSRTGRSDLEPQLCIVSRAEWATRNVSFFRRLVDEALGDDFPAEGGVRARAAGFSTAVQTGALLGLLSRRVLGQYELVLPSDDAGAQDTIYLVGVNVLSMERSHRFRPTEFRFWIALHEVTHRLQFVGVPWLRDYFVGLVEALIRESRRPGRVGAAAAELAKRRRQGSVIDDTGLLGVFASPEQRAVIDRVQALMSVLEGHGHVVMDRIGSRTLVTATRMSRLVKRRRQDPRTRAFYRLAGLEMKFKQYEVGERFVLGVERLAGWHALEALWESANHLPDLAELEDPRAWLARVA